MTCVTKLTERGVPEQTLMTAFCQEGSRTS
jgi:hypothetical protein